MKYRILPFLILVLAAVLIGSVSHAAFTQPWRGSFVSPTVSAPGDNNEWYPITIGPDFQDKAQGLTTTTFFGRGDALIRQATIFLGTLRGGTVVDPNTSNILRFGDQDLGVEVTVDTQDVVHAANYLQSDTLIGSSPGNSFICAQNNGTLGFCTDRCGNFVGVQLTIPSGWMDDGSGNCVSDDVIPAGGSSCQYQMIVTRVDPTHANFHLKHNGVDYTYNDPTTPANQPNLGRMDVVVRTDAGIAQNFIVPHGHATNQYIVPNIGGTTQHATVLDVTPGTINGGEVCWVGY